jgi:hypothetical protein
MLTWEANSGAPFAAGEALKASGWNLRKEAKLRLRAKSRQSSHWKKRNSAVQKNRQTRNTAQSMAAAVDLALDRFVARVERLVRERGAEGVLRKIDELMPEREAAAEETWRES